MPDIEKVITGLELCTNISPDGCLMLCPYKDEKDETYSGFCEQVLKQDALELLKMYKKKIESESEKTTLIDEALEVGRCVLRRGIYLGSDKQWIRVSMTTKEAEKIFGTLRQMKDKQT